MRTRKEILVDRLLLLYTVQQANTYGYMEGPFKLQKLPFAAQLKMNSQREKGFNYTFFRYEYGPISTEIYEDRDALQRAGFLASGKGPIKLTDKGREILRSVARLLARNEGITSRIDWAAKRYANLTFGQLKSAIYQVKVRCGARTVPIADIPPCVNILTKLAEDEAELKFRLTDDWLDSLWGIFDYSPDDWEKLKTVRRGRS